MSVGRLVAGGPHYYALRPDSDVGGEVYERMLLERLPAHGIDLVLFTSLSARAQQEPPAPPSPVLAPAPDLVRHEVDGIGAAESDDQHGRFFADADYLLLRPRRRDLDYAIPSPKENRRVQQAMVKAK